MLYVRVLFEEGYYLSKYSMYLRQGASLEGVQTHQTSLAMGLIQQSKRPGLADM